MKLDSEKQRETLLKLLGVVGIQTTFADVATAHADADKILDPIRNAEIEEPVPALQKVE